MARKKQPGNKKQKLHLHLMNRPEPKHVRDRKQKYDRIACVFQGGGALGAYQVGAFRALHEYGYAPDFLAGVSIGAINCAIIAGNPREKQLEKLHEFWDQISPRYFSNAMSDDINKLDFYHHLHNQMGAMQAIAQGLDGFFRPRILPYNLLSTGTPDTLSYYDTSDLEATLEKLIDFDLINEKRVTLSLGAVNVVSGEMVFFNNQEMEITPKHIMASGALPPGFPAVKIGEDYYWDGGLFANTPLISVMTAEPELDTLCFVVDCFNLQGEVPTNMDQLEERQKDIRYASRSRRMTHMYSIVKNLQLAIRYLGDKLPAEALDDPDVQNILDLANTKRFSVVHIIHKSTRFAHFFKDFNFVRSAVNYRLEAGYRDTQNMLVDPQWEKQSSNKLSCSIYGVPRDYFRRN